MTKVKDNKSNPAIDDTNKQLVKNYPLVRTEPTSLTSARNDYKLVITPKDIHNWRAENLIGLSKRLSATISALKERSVIPIEERGAIPTLSESLSFIISMMQSGYKGFSYRLGLIINNNKLLDDKFALLGKKPTPTEILNSDFSKTFRELLNNKDTSLESCLLCCVYLSYLYDPDVFSLATNSEKKIIMMIETLITQRSCEAIGYSTAKLEQLKTADKGNTTIKEQRAIKEEHVTDAFLRLSNDNREALKNLSQNKIAKRIQEKAIDTLKYKTTKTGVPVLGRIFDEDGNFKKYHGLEIDTVIDIMKKTDRFKLFNPFKPKTA